MVFWEENSMNNVKWLRSQYMPCFPLGDNHSRITECERHVQLSRRAAAEGSVLLKNTNHLLPFQKGTKVAIFGKAQIDYVKGGGGSGDVTVAYTRNLYEGIKALKGKICVYEELADFYRENVKEQYKAGRVPGMTLEPQVPQELLQKAKA